MTTVKRFRFGDAIFTHCLDTTDDSITLKDESGKVLLVYDACSAVHTAAGELLGRFRLETFNFQSTWIWRPEGSSEARVFVGYDILDAEVEVSRAYVEQAARLALQA